MWFFFSVLFTFVRSQLFKSPQNYCSKSEESQVVNKTFVSFNSSICLRVGKPIVSYSVRFVGQLSMRTTVRHKLQGCSLSKIIIHY